MSQQVDQPGNMLELFNTMGEFPVQECTTSRTSLNTHVRLVGHTYILRVLEG